MNIPEELEKLQQLRQSGALSEEDYAKAKAKILSQPPTGAPGASEEGAAEDRVRQTRLWCMFVHFSIFAGYVIPFAGLVLPIVLWQIKKNEMPEVDVHGKIVLNWIITGLIYFVVSFVLSFIFIGFFCFLALGIMAIVFPIIGGIKANNGEAWKYPLTFSFLK